MERDPSNATDRRVRVFISSTFRDMHAERDHLVTVVFPELRERCERLGLEFFDVDLRWGVPEKDANGETANSWEYCKKWIDRVEPFFVSLLGQRYGYIPKPQDIRDENDRRNFADLSITEMEIRHATITGKLKRRSFFYLRRTRVPEDAEASVRAVFVEDDDKVEKLKAFIRDGDRPVYDYPCDWTGKGFANLKDFGDHVLEDLWSGVLRDERYVSKEHWRQALGAEPDADPSYTDETKPVATDLAEKLVALAKPPPVSPLDAEREQMETFAESRLRWFQGRTKELKTLLDFVNSTDETTLRLAVVAAVPGQGKSALLAKLWQQLSELPQEGTKSTKSSAPLCGKPLFLVTHFVGATERSASSHALVQRLLDELDRSGIQWSAEERKEGEEPKRDYNSLCKRLANRLRDYSGERRIVILLDALNQLTDGHGLVWLPHRLGPEVRVVISCVEASAGESEVRSQKSEGKDKETPEQQVLGALERWKDSSLRVPLGPLSEGDVREIVVRYLEEYCKELDDRHVVALCQVPQASNPLYLLVMLGELRTLGGDDMNRHVPQLIADLPIRHPDTVSLFRWVLQRLEVFGAEAVKWWCLYLVHGRVGMASGELVDLLARRLGENAASTARLIERGLRRYLQRRGTQLDFFHSVLRQAVLQEFAAQVDSKEIHRQVAEHFRKQSNFLEQVVCTASQSAGFNYVGRSPNGRKAFELVWQIVRAGTWNHLVECLGEIELVEAICSSKLIFDLQDLCKEALSRKDFPPAQSELPMEYLSFLRRNAHFLHLHSEMTFQLAAAWRLGSLIEKAAVKCELDGQFSRPWIKRISREKKHECVAVFSGHKSVVNSCTFSPDGTRLLSCSSDQSVKLWDVATGRGISESQTHTQEVTSCALSDDGRFALTSGGEVTSRRPNDPPKGELRLRDADTLAEIAGLKGHQSGITFCCFIPGQDLCLSADSSTIILWDVEKRKERQRFQNIARGIRAVSLSRDGATMAVGDYQQNVQLFDVSSGRQLAQTILGKAVAIMFSADGRRLIVADETGGKLILDATNLKPIALLEFFSSTLSAAVCDARGLMAFGLKSGAIEIWNIDLLKRVAILEGHAGPVLCCAFTQDGNLLASASWDCTVRIWDVTVALEDMRAQAHTSASQHNDQTRMQSFLSVHQHGGVIKAARPPGYTRLDLLNCGFSPDGRYSFYSTQDRVIVADARSGDEVAILKDGTAKFTTDEIGDGTYRVGAVEFLTFAVSPCSKMLVTTLSGKLAIWDIATGRQITVLNGGYNGDLVVAKFSSDGSHALTGTGNGLNLWDVRYGRLLISLPIKESYELPMYDWSPEGDRLAILADDALRLVDCSIQKELVCFNCNPSGHRFHGNVLGDVGSFERLKCVFNSNGSDLFFDTVAEIKDNQGWRYVYSVQKCDPITGRISEATSNVHSPKWALSHDDSTTAVEEKGGCLRLIRDSGETSELSGNGFGLLDAVFAPDDTVLLCQTQRFSRIQGLNTLESYECSDLILWRLADGRKLGTYPLAFKRAHHGTFGRHRFVNYEFSPDSALLVIWEGEYIRVFNAKTSERIALFICDSGVKSLAISPDSRTFAVCDTAGNAYLLALENYPPASPSVVAKQIDDLIALANHQFEARAWASAAQSYESLMAASGNVTHYGPRVVACLLNAEKQLSATNEQRIDMILSKLDVVGNPFTAHLLRQQVTAKRAAQNKAWWKFW